MKKLYKLHPGGCALGENEKFYSDMEAKGWRLEDRGWYFSRFVPAPPSRARYRIEVCAPEPLETCSALSEGQLAVFEDCGWEYVTWQQMLHIFRAPEGSLAPEFYADPCQQAETVKKLWRSTFWSWFSYLLLWAVHLILYALLIHAPREFRAMLFRELVTNTSLCGMLLSLVPLAVYLRTRDTLFITRTYRRLKQGVPLDHDPQKRHTLHRLFCRSLLALALLFTLLSGLQLLTTRTTPLPDEADGPYLLLRDLGCQGERTTFLDWESEITCTRSLLADHWDSREYLQGFRGGVSSLYQEVYRLRRPDMAQALAQALMESGRFHHGFTPVRAEGLDAAWVSEDGQVVAVKGELVAVLTCSERYAEGFDPQELFTALAERWRE